MKNQVNQLINDYAKLLSDVTSGKGSDKHYPFILEKIKQLNNIIESALLTGQDCMPTMKLAYLYYRLREDVEVLHNSSSSSLSVY